MLSRDSFTNKTYLKLFIIISSITDILNQFNTSRDGNVDIEKINVSNWRIHYIDILYSEQDTFNEISCFIINEVCEADTTEIEKKNRLITIRFPVAYSYLDVLKKFEKYCLKIIIDIDCEGGRCNLKE